MSINVHIKNFQSIVDSTLTIDGFSVVTGSNNSGKSALMRAIQGVFTNADGKSLVRKGQKSLYVSITFEDGQNIIWEKGKNVNRYTVNGKTLDKVGRGVVPQEVKDFGIYFLDIGNKKVWPQFAKQWSGQIFLLDQTGATVAEAIADIERVGRLNQSLRKAETEKRSVNSKLSVRQSDLKDVLSSLKKYEELPKIEEELEKISLQQKKIAGIYNTLKSLISFRDSMKNSKLLIERLLPVREVVCISQKTVEEAVRTSSEVKELLQLKEKRDKALSLKEDVSKKIYFLEESYQDLPLFSNSDSLLSKIQEVLALKKEAERISSLKVGIKSEIEECTGNLLTIESDILEIEKELEERRQSMGELKFCSECGREF